MTVDGHAPVAAAVEQLVIALVRQPRLPGDPEPGELSTFQSIVLTCLVDDGPMRLGALADVVGTTDATASRNVDVLEALDLVERVPDDADGRGVLVAATPAGRATVRERRARLAALVGQLIERLGPEDGPRFAELLTELRAVLAHAGRAPVSSGG
jgi:DNA-binding MarR family transcriptional regulator